MNNMYKTQLHKAFSGCGTNLVSFLGGDFIRTNA